MQSEFCSESGFTIGVKSDFQARNPIFRDSKSWASAHGRECREGPLSACDDAGDLRWRRRHAMERPD